MARRLSKSQKLQIVEGYRNGKSSTSLATEFCCSSNTITRTIKSILSSEDYLALKELKLKENFSDKDNSSSRDQISIKKLNELKKNDLFESDPSKKSHKIDSSISHQNNDNSDSSKIDKASLALEDADDFVDNSNEDFFDNFNTQSDNDLDMSSVFKEVAPLITDFGFEDRDQKVNCTALKPGVLPSKEPVYFLVDRKVELENIYLKDLPDWDFLPEVEKERKVIPLFDNHREAKRNCSKQQKVIKIADTSIFIITKPYLLSKGISRLIFRDLLISLDS